MPLRFSEIAQRGKPMKPWSDPDSGGKSSRPITANSYDFRPSPSQSHSAPDRESCYSQRPSVPTYDNGTGLIDPRLVKEQGLPTTVQTVAEFVKQRSQQQGRASQPQTRASTLTAASKYSYTIDSTGIRRSDSRDASYFPQYSQPQSALMRVNSRPTMVSGLRSKYARPGIHRVLPGSTRKHKYQGYWLSRGTLRKPEIARETRKSFKTTKEERPPLSKGAYVETSGWYDSG